METRTLETVRIPTSFYYDGLWQAADWSATVTDETTGQVLLTVILQQDGHPAPLAAVRLGMDDVAKLRQLAGFGRGCAQAEEQRRYDCRTTKEHLESLERTVTSLHEHQVLDARRVEKLESSVSNLDSCVKNLTTALGACASSATVHAQGERLTALERQQREQALVLVGHDERLEAIDGELGDQTQRLSAIENRLAALDAA
jgi:hypothetical protein